MCVVGRHNGAIWYFFDGADEVTERTIRSTAKELAGKFYELNASAEARGEKVHVQHRGRTLQTIEPGIFRKCFPTVKAYINGERHGYTEHLPNGVVRHVDDGAIYSITPGWAHWYDAARQTLVAMLADPHTHENVKAAIMDAIIEDREKQLKQEEGGIKPADVVQRHHMEAKN